MAGAVRQQAITWANVDPDLCHCMVSVGHSESNMAPYGIRCFLLILVQVMDWHLISAKPLLEPLLTYHETCNIGHTSVGDKIVDTQT